MEPGGVRSYPARDTDGNVRTAIEATACDMKSCQISAGSDPPNTSGNPSTLCMGTSPCGYPTHTHVTSCGT